MNADIFCTLVTTLLAQGISANIFGDGRHRTSVTIVQSLRAQTNTEKQVPVTVTINPVSPKLR
ncbi:hypothetical protein LPL9_1103 [Lacticaseibacillus paracasei]|nr:hypothetical protein LPL9_1103 [Lacticaseibacillus paracasei]